MSAEFVHRSQVEPVPRERDSPLQFPVAGLVGESGLPDLVLEGDLPGEECQELRRAGADTVISPAAIGGHLLVESAFGRGDTGEVARHVVEE